MKMYIITLSLIQEYGRFLFEEEKSKSTREKYVRDVRAFYEFLPEGKQVSKEAVIEYKRHLSYRYKVSSINSMLVALNVFFYFMKWEDCRVKLLRIQRSAFRSSGEGLTQEEYKKLIETAEASGNNKMAVLLQTMCSTGIRVGELQFITVESAERGKAVIQNKGKNRVILIPRELGRLLKDYCGRQGIESGMIFATCHGRPMDRSNIWREMKKLGLMAGIELQKVFPHNLRHLFAITYYEKEKNIIYLSDIMGHSSVETTRIYTSIDEMEHYRKISEMGLVLSEV